MSTTFDVYPTTERIPSFEELLDVGSRHLKEFLCSYGIDKRVHIAVGMRSDDDRVLPLTLTDPAWWPEDQYAWFHVPDIAGGTDVYARVMDDLNQSILSEDVAVRRDGLFAAHAQKALKVGRYWYFRRSAGQPAIINVAYGMLAAALAELTDGIIDSGDNAWDYSLFPARPAEFLSWYFRPEVATDSEKREWAERCINALSGELRGRVPWSDDAPAYFDTAGKTAKQGQYEIAIELYLTGLDLDPDNVSAHQALREVALRRKAAGGKSLGLLQQMRHWLQRGPRQKMLAAEKLLAYDPANTEWMAAVAQAASSGGFVATAAWITSVLRRATTGPKDG